MMSNKSIKIILGCLIFGVVSNIAIFFYCQPASKLKYMSPFETFLVKSGVTLPPRSHLDYLLLIPCPRILADLGPIKFNATSNSTHLHMVDKNQTLFLYGGYNKMITCTPDTSVAVIVPLPASSQIPAALVSHLHVLLSKQRVESRMYVVQQCAGKFDPGRLFMAAFFEINKINKEKSRETKCYVLNEPRFVPVDTWNMYRCKPQPKQLLVTIRDDDDENKVQSFQPTLGGAFALSHEQILTIAQDTAGLNDDWSYAAIAKRLLAANYIIEKGSPYSGVYVLNKAYDQPENVSVSEHHNIEDMNLFENDVTGSSQHYVLAHEVRRDYSYLKIHLPELRATQTTTDSLSVSTDISNKS